MQNEDQAATASKYDEHWGERRLKWGSIPQVRRYIANRLGVSTGEEPTANALAERLRRIVPPNARAVSVGCGRATTEIDLLKKGVVDHFIVFDLSPVALKLARRAANLEGVADRFDFRLQSGFEASDLGQVDLMFWKSALHHMYDTREAIRWSRDLLAPGGVFFAFDYVGPTLRQYPKSMVRACNTLLRMLPEHVISPSEETGLQRVAPRLRVPSPERMIAKDPSETADSGNILPAFLDLMPDGVVTPIGATVARLIIAQLGANLQAGRDDKIIDLLLAADDVLCDQGVFYNACLEWTKPVGPPNHDCP